MTVIRFDTLFPDGTPRGTRTVLVALVDGGAGGSADGKVIGDTVKVHLDAAGLGTADLKPNPSITPAGTFYRCTLKGAQPSVVRNIVVGTATAANTSWADAAIQVLSPSPPAYSPVSAPYLVDAHDTRGTGFSGLLAWQTDLLNTTNPLASFAVNDGDLVYCVGLAEVYVAHAGAWAVADPQPATNQLVTPKDRGTKYEYGVWGSALYWQRRSSDGSYLFAEPVTDWPLARRSFLDVIQVATQAQLSGVDQNVKIAMTLVPRKLWSYDVAQQAWVGFV